MLTALAVLGGFGLDLLLADPAWMPHPVVGMGRAIAALEKRLRRLFPATPAGERAAGRVLAAALPLGTFALAAGRWTWPTGCTRRQGLPWRRSGAGRRWPCGAWPTRAAKSTPSWQRVICPPPAGPSAGSWGGIPAPSPLQG